MESNEIHSRNSVVGHCQDTLIKILPYKVNGDKNMITSPHQVPKHRLRKYSMHL